MYTEHQAFLQPDNEHMKVWRYMDFTKLVSLLDSRALYFARPDKFNDPFEGSYPKTNIEARRHPPREIPLEGHEAYRRVVPLLLAEMHRNWLGNVAINCWHMNEHESAAMWNLYLKSHEGVAIQSTYSKLRESFIEEERVYLGVVKYIDYDREFFRNGNIFTPFVHKRKSFEHEREVRAVVERNPSPGSSGPTISRGLLISVDLEKLVERIYVAPTAPDWFARLVEAVTKKYGCGFQVVHSRLDEQPLF